MKRINIGTPEFTWDDSDPEGFRAGMARLGGLLGAKETGISVYELPPGQSICPYHYECGEEEWLLVLSGNPSLRSPGGEERLAPWDVACFPRGPEGAHAVRNDTAETARVLMFSTVVTPTATVYPDSDKVGVWTGDKETDVVVRRSSRVGYYDGET
ncbi:MAG: Cupin 2 conserved barrel domain protein [Solirubrobacterales bacterium]|nr:Cupin 2 conserved barrel domain protein [Solirubrobacterales bacterium]